MSYSENPIPIVPVVYSSDVKYISSFRYAVNDFDVNKQITFRILLLDQNSQPLEVKTVELAGCDYANWGNDDTYLVNYISKKLGFTANTIPCNNTQICPFHTTDSSNNSFNLTKLMYDASNNLILPSGYSHDSNNNVIDSKGNIVSYQFLSFNDEGIAVPYGSLSVDSNNNVILPSDATIDSNGYARNNLGQHIIIVSPL